MILALALLAIAVPAWPSDDWARVPTPNAVDGSHNFLQGLECVASDDCWAVGYDTSGSQHTLTSRWDGAAWTLVPSPNPVGGTIVALSGVGCAASDDCWAVGSFYDGLAYRALSIRWDGDAWTLVEQPSSSATGSDLLYDVECPNADACWAVGATRPGALGGVGPNQTLIRRWDGSAWSTSPAPTGVQGAQLGAVECVSDDGCWAVGSYAAPGGSRTLILRWDGQTWSTIPSPNTAPNQANALNSVTCTSAHDCWAVGIYTGQQNQALAMRWDGASWSLVPIPSSGPGLANVLAGVSCTSPDDCWAVGYQRESTWLITLIERWDGEEWRIVPSPNSAYGQTNVLWPVECVDAECWAAGHYYGTGSIARTQALHHQGPPTVPEPGPRAPSVVDPPGDANALNGQGSGQTLDVPTDPASIAGADLVGMWLETTYDTVIERDEQGMALFVRHIPTGLRVQVKTSSPTRPTFGPTLTYRVPVTIDGSCQAWLSFYVRGDAAGSLDREGAELIQQGGCSGTAAGGATLAFEGNRSIATYPFATSGGTLGSGTELAPWSRLSVRVAAGNGAQQLFTAPALDEAAPISSFVIGSDVPPDIDCRETPSASACAG